MKRIAPSLLRAVGDVALLWLATTLVLVFLVDPSPFHLALPPGDTEDGLAQGLLVKTVMEVGWYPITTPWIGAPFGAALYDYPFSDALNLAIIKVLGWFAGDWRVVANLFLLLGFYLCGLAAYVVMRRLAIARAWAVAGALVFVFLPYHLLRREHILLASYFTIPLGVLLAWYAWRGAGVPSPRARHLLPRVALVAIVGSGGAYYAFFSAGLVALAAAARMLKLRSWRAGVLGGMLAGGIALTVLANVLPSFLYWAAHGSNPEVAVRAVSDSERYGLKLVQMILPRPYHRVDALRDIAQDYQDSMPLVNENRTVALGLAGSVGLLILAVMILRRLGGSARRPSARASFLMIMASGAFVIGTIGGVGAMFALTISPMIRAYNRISVAIAFVALAALFMTLQRAAIRARLSRVQVIAVATAIAFVAVLEQTPRVDRRDRTQFPDDRAFIAAAEKVLPPGTMVWQMPHQPFPESYAVHKMPLYGPLRGYLNSSTLRWSYGAIKGREGDAWTSSLAMRPVEEQVDLAARSGFGAVYVDRRGYVGEAAAVLKTLRELLGAPIAQSSDGDLLMFRMTPRGTVPLALREVEPPWDRPIDFAREGLFPLVTSVSGFGQPETGGRWTIGPVARVNFTRRLPLRFVLRIETRMAMAPTIDSGVTVSLGSVERTFPVTDGTNVVEIPFAHSTTSRRLDFWIRRPATPRSLGLNDDDRQLGVLIKSITILPLVGP